ncbi:MAG: PD-(D/E)XK nuclease family transposase [Leptospiraceae bacterium]|nr:PD-(D/E)XK nuclease family transposase [Leptospiraceae bacterium]
MKQKDTEKQNGLLPLYSDIVFKIFCIKKPHLLARLLDAVLGFKGSDRIESLQILNLEIALTKDLEIHIIELPKFLKQVEELDTELENWLYFLGKAEHLQENEMKELQERNPVMEEAIEALKDISLDEKTRAYCEMRLKSERDFMAMKHYAYHEGLKKGIEQERLLAGKREKRGEHKKALSRQHP